jgi:hypothetical protein
MVGRDTPRQKRHTLLLHWLKDYYCQNIQKLLLFFYQKKKFFKIMSNWIYENSLNSNKSVMNWPKYYNMCFYLNLSLKMVGITLCLCHYISL